MGAKPEETPSGDVAEVTGVAEFFPGKYIAQVDFYKGNADSQQCIANRNAGMSECAWIEQNKIYCVDLCLLHPINDLVFSVALETAEVVTQVFGHRCQPVLDVGQTSFAIDTRLARAKQVEIRTINQEQARHDQL